MKQAKAYFSVLSGKNTFQPKVLAKVSHNSLFVVGCSISVSSFLRPHKRIVKLKCKLREAVVFDRLVDPSNQKRTGYLLHLSEIVKKIGLKGIQKDNLKEKS